MQSFLKPLAYAVLGSMLPRQKELQSHINNGSKGILFLIMGAVLMGFVILSLLSGMFFLLVEAGQTRLSAGLITTLFALVVSIVFLKIGENYVKATAAIVESLRPQPARLPVIEAQLDVGEVAASLWHSFSKGFHKSAPVREELSIEEEVEMAIMLEQLKSLKERIEHERKHLQDRIRMEAAIHGNKDIIRFRPRDSV